MGLLFLYQPVIQLLAGSAIFRRKTEDRDDAWNSCTTDQTSRRRNWCHCLPKTMNDPTAQASPWVAPRLSVTPCSMLRRWPTLCDEDHECQPWG